MTVEEAIELLDDIKFTSSDYPRDVKALEMAIKALKEPERKKGKWIDAREHCGEFLCSNCHETNINNFYKYCPYCGAEMEGEECQLKDDTSNPFDVVYDFFSELDKLKKRKEAELSKDDTSHPFADDVLMGGD